MIGNKIDTFEILIQTSIKSLFEKVEVFVTVSKFNTQKVDLSIIYFQILHSAAQCLKNLHIKQRNNEQYYRPQKKFHAKIASSLNG